MTMRAKRLFLPGAVLLPGLFAVLFLFVSRADSQAVPTSPSPLVAKAVSSSRIDLNWQNPAGESGFLIYRSKNSSLANAVIFQAAANAVSFSDGNLEAVTTYYYQVYACNDVSCTASNVANAATGLSPAPASFNQTGINPALSALPTPENLTVQAVSSCAFKISWNPSAGADAYDLERNGITEASIATTDEVGKKSVTDKDNDALWQAEDAQDHIDPGEAYAYRVRAKNSIAGTTGDWSSSVSDSALPLPPKPGTPKDIATNFNEATGNLELRWAMNTPASALFPTYGGFEIWREVSTDGGNSFGQLLKIDRIPASQLENGKFYYYDNKSVSAASAYSYVLKSQEVGGEGCNSLRAQHIIVSDNSPVVIVPPAPDKLNAVFQENPRKIILNWADNSRGKANEARFEILRSTSQSFAPAQTAPTVTVASGESKYEDTSIEQAGTKTYWYKVRACTATACSAYSSVAVASTGIPAPYGLVAAATAIGPTTVGVSLSWKVDLVLSGTEFWINRWEEGNRDTTYQSKKVTRTNCGATPNACIDEVVRGKRYEYQVLAQRTSSAFVVSETVKFNTNLTPIKGWAWGGHGLGWIRLSNDSVASAWGDASAAPNESANPYSVYIENDTGNLGGYAWSPYAGWLSFNDSGCPVGYTSNCRAKALGVSTDQIRQLEGFAKFIDDAAGNGLDRWMSLAKKGTEPDYGLYYSKDLDGNGELRGFAWGGDVAGWVTFGGPVLKEVKNVGLDTQNAGKVKVELTWDNLIDYTAGVEIWGDKLSQGTFTSLKAFNPGSTETQQGLGKKAVINGLEPDTTYRFFVRGNF